MKNVRGRALMAMMAALVALGSATGCADQPTAAPERATLRAPAEQVQAAAVSGRVASGGTYNLRSGPGTGYSIVGTLPGGSQVWITCQEYGTTHTGPWGTSNIWDKLTDGRWISDAFVYTGRNGFVAPRCSTINPPVRGDDYPYRNDPVRFNPNGCSADPWAFCKRNCTSFAAWRVRQSGVAFHNFYRGVRWSHAKGWANVARSLGIPVDRTPRVGDVAHWNGSTSMPYGHVAYVAAVHANGTITIEEYNHDLRGNYRTRTISASSVSNFIHPR